MRALAARASAEGPRRIEFALQQRVDGEWGKRQLPSSRFFPADVGHNRWLNSTPITVSVDESAVSLPPTPAGLEPPGLGITSSAWWEVGHNEFTDARFSRLFVLGRDADVLYDPALWFWCEEGRLDVFVTDLPISDLDDRFRVQERWGSEPAETNWYRQYRDNSFAFESAVAVRRAARYDTLLINVTGWVSSVRTEFDLTGIREAPNWPEIANCGS